MYKLRLLQQWTNLYNAYMRSRLLLAEPPLYSSGGVYTPLLEGVIEEMESIRNNLEEVESLLHDTTETEDEIKKKKQEAFEKKREEILERVKALRGKL